jgi:hypothetical protein
MGTTEGENSHEFTKRREYFLYFITRIRKNFTKGKERRKSTTNSRIIENRLQTSDISIQPRREGDNNELH